MNHNFGYLTPPFIVLLGLLEVQIPSLFHHKWKTDMLFTCNILMCHYRYGVYVADEIKFCHLKCSTQCIGLIAGLK